VDEPLRLNEKESVILGFVSDFYALLGAIDETMPKNSVLCLEGTSVASDVVAFLEQRQASEPPAIKGEHVVAEASLVSSTAGRHELERLAVTG
jgi:hypothetical protein